jgi:uncharacterized protein (TIGR04255 family)
MQDKPTVFGKSPVQEALIDVRVVFKDGFDFETLEGLHEELKDTLPIKTLRRSKNIQFTHAANKKPSIVETEDLEGYLLKDQLGQSVLQITRNGVTFSVIGNYKEWGDLKKRFDVYWKSFAKKAELQEIKRVGIRYINRIDLPMPVTSLKEWLHTRPAIGEGITDNVGELFMRVAFLDNNDKCIITEAINSQEVTDTHLPLILDIDAFYEDIISADDTTALDTVLGRLHALKNRVFLNSITDKTKELLK